MSPTSEDSTLNSFQVESVNEYDDTKAIQGVDDNSDFTSAPTKIERKRGTISIDVTKAFMVMGFSSWSSIEQGKLLKRCFHSIVFSKFCYE